MDENSMEYDSLRTLRHRNSYPLFWIVILPPSLASKVCPPFCWIPDNVTSYWNASVADKGDFAILMKRSPEKQSYMSHQQAPNSNASSPFDQMEPVFHVLFSNKKQQHKSACQYMNNPVWEYLCTWNRFHDEANVDRVCPLCSKGCC